MNRYFFSLVLLCSATAIFAQQPTAQKIPRAAVVQTSGDDQGFHPVIRPIEMPKPVSGSRMNAIKDSLAHRYPAGHPITLRQQPQTASVSTPFLNRNFQGNNFNNSTPNDNEIAISNDSKIISVQNSTLFRYNATTNTAMGAISLSTFALPLGNTSTKYDPKVTYDPEANRFIVVFLAGYTSANTHIIIGFSRSDSINGTWNLYSIPGNPNNDTLWSDYPMMAVNQQELFVTINLLHDNQSWQLGFVQSLIWQINKWDGYNGDSLRLQMHQNINYGNRAVRNLCPVEGGSFPSQGRDQWFLSNRNLDPSNDTIFLVHLSDTINAPGQNITVTPLIAPTAYFMPVSARQNDPNDEGMATNDSRVLGAFLENDRIQFVSNTLDTSTGNPAIFNGIISNVSSSPSLQTHILSDPLYNYGYPNIAYAGYNASDNTAMIIALHSDTTGFPGYSAFATDGNGVYSSRLNVKSGAGYINVLSGQERWGDYTGIQRRYDLGGTVWVNGMYGNTAHSHSTWIAELAISPDVSVPTTNTTATESAQVFPNPFENQLEIRFQQPTTQRVRFAIYDVNGKLVEVLLEDQVKAGRMQLTFSPAPLPAGIYLLRGEAADGSVLFTERIVRQ